MWIHLQRWTLLHPSAPQTLIVGVLLLFLLLPSATLSKTPSSSSSPTSKPKVLIVGAGITGASTAYFLQHLYSHSNEGTPRNLFEENENVNWRTKNLLVEITVINADEEVGGRIRSMNLPKTDKNNESLLLDDSDSDDGEGSFIELGASVYHDVNFYMVNFVRHFNFSVSHPYLSSKLGIWAPKAAGSYWTGSAYSDEASWARGGEFLFREYADESEWKTILRALWRYGLSPLKAKWCAEQLVQQLLKIYPAQLTAKKAFHTAEALIEFLGLMGSLETTLETFLSETCGVGQLYRSEIIFALARLNYGQGLSMTALPGIVATKGRGNEVHAIKGGNVRLVKALFKAAGATVHNGITVDWKFSHSADTATSSSSATATTSRATPQWPPELHPTSSTPSTQHHKAAQRTATALVLKQLNERLSTGYYDIVIVAHPLPTLPMHVTHVTVLQGQVDPAALLGATTQPAENKKEVFESDDEAGSGEPLQPQQPPQQEEHAPLPTIIGTSEQAKNTPGVWWRSIGQLRATTPPPAEQAKKITEPSNKQERNSFFYKVFSDEKLTSVQLASVFGNYHEVLSQVEWKAYPSFTPSTNVGKKESKEREEKHSFVLVNNTIDNGQRKVQKLPLLILHAGALEFAVSTMETQCIAAMNTALIAQTTLQQYYPATEEMKAPLEEL